MRDTTLFAHPFDPKRLELSGGPVTVANGVGSFPGANHGLFSASETGLLAYQPGKSAGHTQLTWLDARGLKTGSLGDPADYGTPAISPDGSRVAVGIGLASARDIWIIDVARGIPTRFTFDPANDDVPVWSPDGKYIAFSSNRSGRQNLYVKPAGNLGEERLLFNSEAAKLPLSWPRDGRILLFQSYGATTSQDI